MRPAVLLPLGRWSPGLLQVRADEGRAGPREPRAIPRTRLRPGLRLRDLRRSVLVKPRDRCATCGHSRRHHSRKAFSDGYPCCTACWRDRRRPDAEWRHWFKAAHLKLVVSNQEARDQ